MSALIQTDFKPKDSALRHPAKYDLYSNSNVSLAEPNGYIPYPQEWPLSAERRPIEFQIDSRSIV